GAGVGAGAATVLFVIFVCSGQVEFRAVAKIPGPSVRLTLLPSIVKFNVPLSVVVASLSESQPIPMPDEPTALLTTSRLLFAVADIVAGPKSDSSIPTPSMWVIGFARVPLLETL